MRALAQRDILKPFPVQQLVMRDALAGHDLLVQSPTGSGKTLAFGVLDHLIEQLGDDDAYVHRVGRTGRADGGAQPKPRRRRRRAKVAQ